MKFIYFIIVGLLVFNGVLTITAGLFNSGFEEKAVNVTGTYGKYSLNNNTTSILGLLWTATAGGTWNGVAAASVIAIGGLFGAILLGKYVIVAVALFLGLITALYINVSSVLFKLDSNIYIQGLITLVSICIGVLVLYNIVEMFTGQGGDV